MKTTVYIDDDLFIALKEEARQSGTSLRSLLNQALRKGLQDRPAKRRSRYRCPEFSLGPMVALSRSADKALALASDFEDAEIIRKLEQRK